MDEQKALVTNAPCPVCGFDLAGGAREFSLCPSCGTEFGYSDATRTHEELRNRWISLGAPWGGRPTLRPARWDPAGQLEAAGFAVAAKRLRAHLGEASHTVTAALR
jgi:hypothetical protein